MHLPEPQDDSWTTFFVARVQAIFQADSTGPCRSNFNRLDGNLKDGHAVAAIVAVEKVKAAGLKLGMRASGAIDFVLRDLVGVGFLDSKAAENAGKIVVRKLAVSKLRERIDFALRHSVPQEADWEAIATEWDAVCVLAVPACVESTPTTSNFERAPPRSPLRSLISAAHLSPCRKASRSKSPRKSPPESPLRRCPPLQEEEIDYKALYHQNKELALTRKLLEKLDLDLQSLQLKRAEQRLSFFKEKALAHIDELHRRLRTADATIESVKTTKKRLRKAWGARDSLGGGGSKLIQHFNAEQCPSFCTAACAWRFSGVELQKYKPGLDKCARDQLASLLADSDED